MVNNMDGVLLDVNIIISEDTDKLWVTQCIDSVNNAIAKADYSIKLHIVDGVPGHIGKARALAISKGSAPYVTSVDDDDYVLPEAFSILSEALKQNPDAIFTKETTLQNGHFREGRQRHHLAVYKRELLINYNNWPCFDSLAQRTAVKDMNIIDIPTSVYVHRIYLMSKARVLRRKYPHLLEIAHG